MPSFDFSFSRYVAARKGSLAARAREGAAYAYGPERRVRERLASLRPVTLALEAARRWFGAGGRDRLLAGATAVGDQSFPTVARLVGLASERLSLGGLQAFVSPEAGRTDPQVLGTADAPLLIVPGRLLDGLGDAELMAAIGAACGRIQNGHAELLTALAGLEHQEALVARWAATPARLALRSWAARAVVTADRAALVVSRDVSATLGMIVKTGLGERRLMGDVDLAAVLAAIDSAEPVEDQEAIDPRVVGRVRALRLFARTAYARGVFGQETAVGETPPPSLEDCDAATSRVLAEAGA